MDFNLQNSVHTLRGWIFSASRLIFAAILSLYSSRIIYPSSFCVMPRRLRELPRMERVRRLRALRYSHFRRRLRLWCFLRLYV